MTTATFLRLFGVKAGLQFSPEQCRQSRENCRYVAEKSHAGIEFLEKVVRPLLEKHRPGLLRIHPLHAYLGGDVKDTALTANFLRNHLYLLLAQFQCGCIIVHHTPKVTFRDTKEWKASDWMYAGAGAADITNWCRAALIIDPNDKPAHLPVHRRQTCIKNRVGGRCDRESGNTSVISRTDDNGTIYWRMLLTRKWSRHKQKGAMKNRGKRFWNSYAHSRLSCSGRKSSRWPKTKHKFGEHKTRQIVSILIEKESLGSDQEATRRNKACRGTYGGWNEGGRSLQKPP